MKKRPTPSPEPRLQRISDVGKKTMIPKSAVLILSCVAFAGCYKADYEKASAAAIDVKAKLADASSKLEAAARDLERRDAQIASISTSLEGATQELAAKRGEIERLHVILAEKEKAFANMAERDRLAEERKVKADLRVAIELQKELIRDANETAMEASLMSVIGQKQGNSAKVASWRQKFRDYKPKILELTRVSIDNPKLEEIARGVRGLPDTTREGFDDSLNAYREALDLHAAGVKSGFEKRIMEGLLKLSEVSKRTKDYEDRL